MRRLLVQLHRWLEKKLYDDTYDDLLQEIEDLKDEIYRLEDRLECVKSERDYWMERRGA